MRAQKQIFTLPQLRLQVGESIAATVGYETYGQLNGSRDNAILLCHPFAATSHAAGWWEPLIGSGRAFDTDRSFVIAVDSLCNLNVKDPTVVTTGPATRSPRTGEPYGMTFPQITVRDNVRLQQQLVTALGVRRLACVAGPCTGGFQALEWAVTYPDQVDQVIAVASAPVVSPLFGLAVCQAAIDVIQQGGGDGLVHATQLLLTLTRSNDWLEAIWGRRTAALSAHPWADRQGQYTFQSESEAEARRLAARFDPQHFVYAARSAILHDIGCGNRGLEAAVEKIKAELLLIPVTSDLLFPPSMSEEFADLVCASGGSAQVVPLASWGGHQAAFLEAHRLAEPIRRFLRQPVLH